MALPPLVHYVTPQEYEAHYQRVYCQQNIFTSDGIRIYFKRNKFSHAFYESSRRDGNKDTFSPVRAERIDWIKATLTNPNATLFKGWNRKTRQYDDVRRVAVAYEDFVVIASMYLSRQGELRGNFITCYQADNSINLIRQSPLWSRQDCLNQLGGT